MTPVTKKLIITVDGLDGSGKSTFARRVFTALAEGGARPVLFRVDDFRQPVAWTTPDHEADQYFDAYYDLAQCEGCLRAFAAGAPRVTIPLYDIGAERVTGARPVELAEADVAVVEGVFPLRMPQAAAGVLIYLEASEAESRRRIVARDLQKGRTVDEITRRIDRRYFPSQRRYRDQFGPRERADIVIDNEAPAAPRVLKRDLSRLPAPVRDLLDALLPPLEPGSHG